MRQSVHVDGTPSVSQRQNTIEITPPVPPRNSNLRASTRLEFVFILKILALREIIIVAIVHLCQVSAKQCCCFWKNEQPL